MKVIISNKGHPDYGTVAVPLPIPREQYDEIITSLEKLNLGAVTDRDCHIDAIINGPPLLQKLVGTMGNIDELDYLAKRLDSYTPKELSTFQAMAEKYKCTDLADLINLSFDVDEAMVITDFSRMDEIGRDYLFLHSPAISKEEMGALDLEQIGKDLIESGKGTMTPYGILYDDSYDEENGFQAYNMESFPAYVYDCDVVVGVVSGFSGATESYLYLPAADQQISRTLKRGNFSEGNYSLYIESSGFSRHVIDSLKPEEETAWALNEMIKAITALTEKQRTMLDAVILYAQPHGATQVKNLALNLDLFEFQPDVWDIETYGRTMIIESGDYKYDSELEKYIDFEAFGRDHMLWHEGRFTELGYVGYCGNDRLDMLMEDNPQQTTGQQMGGIS